MTLDFPSESKYTATQCRSPQVQQLTSEQSTKMEKTLETTNAILQEVTDQMEEITIGTASSQRPKAPPSMQIDGVHQSQKPHTEPPTPQPMELPYPQLGQPLQTPPEELPPVLLDYGALPPQRYNYRWGPSGFQRLEIKKHDNNPQFKNLDQASLTRIYFFTRTPSDPTGSNSPCVLVLRKTRLSEIFNWYHMQTYPGPPAAPVTREEYGFMRIDLSPRTLGRRYRFLEVKQSGLTFGETEWFREGGRVLLVSSDRIPAGSYKQSEEEGPRSRTG